MLLYLTCEVGSQPLILKDKKFVSAHRDFNVLNHL